MDGYQPANSPFLCDEENDSIRPHVPLEHFFRQCENKHFIPWSNSCFDVDSKIRGMISVTTAITRIKISTILFN